MSDLPPSSATIANVSESKIIKLKSLDNHEFDVEVGAALLLMMIKNLMEDTTSDDGSVIPVPTVNAKVLSKAVAYLKRHYAFLKELSSYEAIMSSKSNNSSFYSSTCSSYIFSEEAATVKKYDDDFVKGVKDDQELWFDLIMAAYFLDIKSLLNLLCEAVANCMKGKTHEEIRKYFHIINDYTPEEEDDVCRENQWAFD